MLFNSLDFALFLPIVFGLYWLIGSSQRSAQNLLLLISSYVFYAWWDWAFLGLIMLSSAVDFWAGQRIYASKVKHQRRIWLALSLVVNIGLLLYFKYYNFFIDSFVTAFTLIGQSFTPDRLSIILPVGISFYTFQTLSYTLDIYHGKLKPTNDWVAFGAFVSFFPQLVAGPIERAQKLLPQFNQQRFFSYTLARDGAQQLFWGLFKKVVIADHCAPLVDHIFQHHDQYSGGVLLFGAFLFSFQIYADFSGYSDMAIGIAKLFGFELTQNFSTPYFATNIRSFWRRWHISLSSWFRDYVYIPLGGSLGGRASTIRNILVVFLVSGLWHGAAWNFVLWGFLHGAFFAVATMIPRSAKTAALPNPSPRTWLRLRSFTQALLLFLFVTIAWVFFRAETVTIAWDMVLKIMTLSTYDFASPFDTSVVIALGAMILIMLGTEWLNRSKTHGLQLGQQELKVWQRWVIYHSLLALLLFYGKFNETTFIYFQF